MPDWRDVPYHPVAVATLPILTLYAANQDQVFLSELVTPVALAVAAVVALGAALALAMRDARKGAFAVSFLALLFFTYGAAVRWADETRVKRQWAVDADHVDFVWIVLAVAGVALAWVAKGDGRKLTRILNVAAAAMLVLPVASIVAYQVADDPAGVATATGARDTGLDYRPNVYVFVLDGYAHGDTLRERFGLDNAPFERALEARGFYVVPESRANYAQTYLSVPAMLNADYLPREAATAPTNDVAKAFAEDSTVSRAVRALGYRHVVFASGWGVTNRDASADWVRTCAKVSEFEFSIILNTPLLNADGWMSEANRERIDCQFDDVAEMPGAKGPNFVFAHIVAPHWPYVFAADGSPVDPTLPAADGSVDVSDPAQVAQKQALYAGQVQYVNVRTLEAIDTILADEEMPPVIIITSDHGSDLQAGHDGAWSPSDPEWIRERMRNFQAVYFPGKPREDLYPTMTPINVFRAMLRGYFGADLPPVEDRSWYSTPDHPEDLRDVTEVASW